MPVHGGSARSLGFERASTCDQLIKVRKSKRGRTAADQLVRSNVDRPDLHATNAHRENLAPLQANRIPKIILHREDQIVLNFLGADDLQELLLATAAQALLTAIRMNIDEWDIKRIHPISNQGGTS